MQTVFSASAIALFAFSTLAPVTTAQPTFPNPLQRPIIQQPLRFKLPRRPLRRVQTQLTSFTEWSLSAIGVGAPYGTLLRAKNGNFYGLYRNGGFGVFKMTPTGTLTNVTSLPGTPGAGLVQGSDGNFYGTTANGGSLTCELGCGTVFKMTPAGRVTTLVKFEKYTTGASPNGKLIQGSDGNFYGTTERNGPGGGGTVFRMTPAGLLTTLVNFDGINGANGSGPYAGLIQGSDGNFYGTTLHGGSGPDALGTVFRMTPTGDLTTLVTFTSATGNTPFASLIQAKNGYFYGTTYQGGTYGGYGGTVFRISATGSLKTLANFGGGSATGNGLTAELLQAKDGNFYGTTSFGGTDGFGTLFKMTPQGSVTTLYEFPTDRGVPEGGLVQANGGFYGIETNGYSVFKLVP